MSAIIHPQPITLKRGIETQSELEPALNQTPSSTPAPIPAETNTPTSPPPPAPFPLFFLPPELLYQIACNYYALLPPLTITQSNHRLPHHALTPLALSSPHLLAVLPPSLYYAHATFLFSSPSLLKSFAATSNRADRVRKIKIVHGGVPGPSGPGAISGGRGEGGKGDGMGDGRQDWVFSLLEAFRGLEEVTFVVELGMSEEGVCEGSGCIAGMEGWWECVRDAVREGIAVRDVGKDGGMGMRKGRALVLRVECEGFEGCWVDRIFR